MQLFAKEIARIRKDDFAAAPTSRTPPTAYKHGSVLLLQQYRIDYQLHHEVYAAAVTLDEDSPFEASTALNRVRAYGSSARLLRSSPRLLIASAKGLEITVAAVQRRQTELMFSLDRVLQGDDGLEMLSQKPSELAPNANAQRVCL